MHVGAAQMKTASANFDVQECAAQSITWLAVLDVPGGSAQSKAVSADLAAPKDLALTLQEGAA